MLANSGYIDAGAGQAGDELKLHQPEIGLI